MSTPDGLDRARTVADAVLYEGYLLYPYRSTSSKNQVRWQFGVLGPPGAAAAGLGEEPDLAAECLLRAEAGGAQVGVHLRFLQLQSRQVEQASDNGFHPVAELTSEGATWVTWDEAVAHELPLGPFPLADLLAGAEVEITVPPGQDVDLLHDRENTVVGRLIRRRWPLSATLRLSATEGSAGLIRLRTAVQNRAPERAATAQEAVRASFIGTHLLLTASGAAFLSVLDPPDDAKAAAARCTQRRCWPVLTGEEGSGDVVLASPIILYDHPAVAPESAGALFDSTEIDEILTLRVMTLTDEEKAQARATDAHAAAIIDRCEQMSPQDLQRLHGILRDPHAGTSTLTGDDWWAAEAAADVSPETAEVTIQGVRVTKGSLVKVHPTRRADAQDLFFADQTARVSAVQVDLDGETHVAVTLVDDPAAEMHDWYGRYLYFAPDELEPLTEDGDHHEREESPS